MRALLLLAAAAALAAGPALAAQSVALRAAPSDEDGRITLGELFDGAGRAGAVVVATINPGASAVLDAARVQQVALAHGLSWSNPSGLRRVIVRPGGAVAAQGGGGAVEALTYVRSLATGELVGPEDLAWTKVVAAPAGAPRDANAVIGKAAKRPLRAGATVNLADVSTPQVIKKDDIVSVSYSASGVSLMLQAKALQGAAAGETLNVVNPSSKRIIQVVATGPAEAAVGPASIQYRAQAGAYLALR